MRRVRFSLCSCSLVAVAVTGCYSLGADDPGFKRSGVDQRRLEESRLLVQTFGTQLKGELKKGLAQGGPGQAVRVCKDIAPQIASELSRQSGANISRTSLRYRNPGNAPEPWQARVLIDFEGQAAAAETAAPLEYVAREDDGSVRYMLAIRTEAVCLACHGESIAPQLREIIIRNYPHDRAVGYGAGDIRGAFSVTWPPTDNYSGS